MPRYYFHLTDGKQVLNNHKGIDLPGNAAVREDAVALARDLKGGSKNLSRYGPRPEHTNERRVLDTGVMKAGSRQELESCSV